MSDKNSCLFEGTLTTEPVCRTSKKGVAYMNLQVTVEENNHKVRIECCVFGDLAVAIAEQYKLGDTISIISEAFSNKLVLADGKYMYAPKFNIVEVIGIKMPEKKQEEQVEKVEEEVPAEPKDELDMLWQ